ncbi:hypothetical protein MANES_18G104850v8 [Manihot esculenta]|uniref:Uncharacterized protein n=1 Tax=Manihot esculenta TaxID=3983 RepID=A0ACB7G1K7_MANES|nr:hypothetical protein MANES_18G104850v8 [Manihot esculenta]
MLNNRSNRKTEPNPTQGVGVLAYRTQPNPTQPSRPAPQPPPYLSPNPSIPFSTFSNLPIPPPLFSRISIPPLGSPHSHSRIRILNKSIIKSH